MTPIDLLLRRGACTERSEVFKVRFAFEQLHRSLP
jgi:hypothetical protein